MRKQKHGKPLSTTRKPLPDQICQVREVCSQKEKAINWWQIQRDKLAFCGTSGTNSAKCKKSCTHKWFKGIGKMPKFAKRVVCYVSWKALWSSKSKETIRKLYIHLLELWLACDNLWKAFLKDFLKAHSRSSSTFAGLLQK